MWSETSVKRNLSSACHSTEFRCCSLPISFKDPPLHGGIVPNACFENVASLSLLFFHILEFKLLPRLYKSCLWDLRINELDYKSILPVFMSVTDLP